MELQTFIFIAIIAGAFIGGVVLAILPKIKDKLSKKYGKEINKHNNPLDTLARDIKIQDKLAELRVKIGATRVYISKFHNGEEYFDGTAIKKVSKTHETCERGVSHEFMSYQNVLTSLIPEAMEVISTSKKKNQPIMKCTKSLVNGGFLHNHLSNLGIKTFGKYRLLIGDRLIGYLGVHFEEEGCKDREEGCNIAEEKLQIIKEIGGAIENIFATDPKEFDI